ncbi:hypothetical protein Ancab_024733 [Ancistrocladus abbreviatus]
MASAFCYLYFLVLLPLTITAKTPGNITLGSSLTAGKDNSSWLSPSGDFAFGFQEIQPGSFLLSIWFDKIPEKTIVWSANGDQLAGSGSKIELTTDGRFVLSDPTGKQIWSPGLSGAGTTHGAMLDSGNFLLATSTSAKLWQSFGDPTDTMLPTQTLSERLSLVSRFSEKNYSSGRFEFAMQADGNLVFYTLNFPQSSNNYAYWASNTVGVGYELRYNQSGYLYLTAANGTIVDQTFWDESSTDDFYQRIILEYDGVLRKYVYPKPSSSAVGRWPMQWSVKIFIPTNICGSIVESIGSGACGFNSYCQIGEEGRPQCSCPPGYVWVDPNNELSGCQQNFLPQKCDGGSEEANNFSFEEMANTNWPSNDYGHFTGVAEDWCRAICLADCFCAIAIFGGGECWLKKFPLSNGILNSDVGGKALVKIRISNSTLQQPNGIPKKRDQTTLIITESTLLGSSVLLNIFLLLVASIFVFRPNSKRLLTAQPYEVMPGTSARRFRYDELEEATKNFSEKVGQGAFSTVYKGRGDAETGTIVAVKKLDELVKESGKEFQTEISAIARTNHRNLVQLVGYCSEGQHRLLVYEFMTNGSLSDFLFGDQRPCWYKRVQIALGTARGLNYLHEECGTQIIHCDIKPQNVLLDDSFTARICDFGLAKLLKTDQTRTTTGIRGTKGYVAPEWFRNLPITVKVDVYSYGILLLELVCCRKCLELEAEEENQMILADWAYDCYKEGAVDILLGNDDDAQDDIKRVKKFLMIAIWCIQEDPSLRPSMKKVIQMLEGAIEVSVPPDPSSYISSIQ